MFRKARIKLTAWYLLIIMSISIMFSAAIYSVLNMEVNRFARAQQLRFEHRLQTAPPPELLPPFADQELIEESKQRLLFSLILINGSIFIIAGGLGYVLAGRTLKPIAEMMNEQYRFISDASHEFRTPLTSLKSAMEVNLRDPRLTLNTAKTLIRENILEVNKLQSLSDSLLLLAQNKKPNRSERYEILELETIIRSAIKKVQPIAIKKHMKISSSIKNDISCRGSDQKLTDLFVILLDNAIKYSPGKSTVTIHSEQTDGSAKILVKDSGIGIDEGDIPHVFDRFYRADSARTKTDATGYGLGLAIAKQIVESHHGSIIVESILKKGSTFTVTLPIVKNNKIS
jgi:two-component system, OmpR family, sensor histidine kinase CiaH